MPVDEGIALLGGAYLISALVQQHGGLAPVDISRRGASDLTDA